MVTALIARGPRQNLQLAAGLTAVLGLLLVLRAGPAGVTEPQAPAGPSAAAQRVLSAPLAFEPNAGRTDGRVAFIARTPGGTTFLRKDGGATIALRRSERSQQAISIDLVGGAAAPASSAVDRLPGVVNSFIGNDRSRWRRGLPTFERVRYSEVYPGIDLDWHGNQGRLESDFRVAPGADPGRIALRLRGQERLHLASNGDLVARTRAGELRQRAPVAYQTIDRRRRPVRAAFDLNGDTVRFRVGAYDRSRPLVIDPIALAYSTYLGGSSGDHGFAMEVDSAGAAYIAGGTASTDFPIQDAFQASHGTGVNDDVFVTKLNPDAGGAVTIAYSTYLGGLGLDEAKEIAVDSAGAVYVTGRASGDLPTVDAFQPSTGGNFDAFVTKLNPDTGGAVTLGYSSFLGGGPNGGELGYGIDVDSAGAAYVTGETFGPDDNFPVQDAFEASNEGGTHAIYVAKFNPEPADVTEPSTSDDVTLAYSTLLGGTGHDAGRAVAVDPSGAAYVTGATSSTNFPTEDAFDDTNDGSQVPFVTKIKPDTGGTVALGYSSYFGAGGGEGIAVDSAGAAYLTGSAGSGFPVVDAAFTGGSLGILAFAAKLNPEPAEATEPSTADDLTIAYSGYFGGSNNTAGRDIAIDSTGAAYIAGETLSDDFPLLDALQTDQAEEDLFLTKVNPDPGGTDDATFAYSTYIGGSGADPVDNNAGHAGVAVDSLGAAYVGSESESTDFPTRDPFQANQPDADAIALKVAADGDSDGEVDATDNCPATPNADQANNDADSLGDACDPDDDNDTVADGSDNCPTAANADQADIDGDSLGDACDADDDGDGIADGLDNCPTTVNADQVNNDGDALGDLCDPDDDNDTVADSTDNCPTAVNGDQADRDGDGLGDACDADDDSDGIVDGSDKCPLTQAFTADGCPALALLPDTVAPRAALAGKKRQRLRRSVPVGVVCQDTSEDCIASARGSLSVPGAAKSYGLGAVKEKLIARGARATLRLRVPKRARRAARKALSDGRRVKARITVTVKDVAGNARVLRRTVRLRA